jgi:sporulation protein YlmC with PRC-barrel domain
MKAKYGFILLIMTLVLASCFSPWKDDVGAFSISFGGENMAARQGTGDTFDEDEPGEGGLEEGALNGNDDFYYYISNFFSHTITLSGGPGADQIVENVNYGKTVKFFVTPGLWNINVEAWIDLDKLPESEKEIPSDIIIKDGKAFAAFGFLNSVDIKAGHNGSITIQMEMFGGGGNGTGSGEQENVFIITFDQIKDINPIIIIEEDINFSSSQPAEIKLKVDDPDSYTDIIWSINGYTLGEELSIMLDANNNLYNSVGSHSLSLVFIKDDIPYSKEIIFNVVE